MESLDLTYKLIALKIKSKTRCCTESTLCLKYFWNIVIVTAKGKNEKMKTTKIYLFLLPPLPSQDGGGGGLLQPPNPHPQLFPRQKFLKHFFIDTWVSGQRVGKLTVWQS